jgi:hypothetical protein
MLVIGNIKGVHYAACGAAMPRVPRRKRLIILFCAIFLRRSGVYIMMKAQLSTGILRPDRKMDHLGGFQCWHLQAAYTASATA